MSAPISWGDLLKAAESGPKFDVLPVGDYNMEITETDVKQTRNGETMFAMKCKVLVGPYAGRIIFHNLTVPNPSAENASIRAGYFLNDLKLLGLSQAFIDSQPQPAQLVAALANKQFIGQLDQREYPKDSGTMRNNIKRIKKAPNGGAAGAMPGALPPAPAAAPPAPAPAYAPPAPQAAPQPQFAPPQPQFAPPAPQPVAEQPQQYAQPQAPQQAPPAPQPVAAAAPPAPAPEQYAAPAAPAPAPTAPVAADAPELPASPFGPQ